MHYITFHDNLGYKCPAKHEFTKEFYDKNARARKKKKKHCKLSSVLQAALSFESYNLIQVDGNESEEFMEEDTVSTPQENVSNE